MNRILLMALLLFSIPSFACDGLHLTLGFGYDAAKTFPQTASDFRLEYNKSIDKTWGVYAGYIHHSTFQQGWPFDGYDKNVTDMFAAGIRINLLKIFQ